MSSFRDVFATTVATVSGALFAVVYAPYYAVRRVVYAPLEWYRQMKGAQLPSVEVPLIGALDDGQ
jgi:hypothetical protein